MKEHILNTKSKPTVPYKRDAKTFNWLVYLTFVGLGCFVATVLLLHYLQAGLDPLREAVSYYIHGPNGWLLTVGLVCLGIGSLALTIALRGEIQGPRVKTGCLFLAIWGIGVIIGGIFPADPPGNWSEPPSFSGMIHGNVAMVAFLSLPIAAVIISRSFRSDSREQRNLNLPFIFAIMTFISLGMFMASLITVIISPGPPILLGLTERILLGAYVLWMSVVAGNLYNRRDHRKIKI